MFGIIIINNMRTISKWEFSENEEYFISESDSDEDDEEHLKPLERKFCIFYFLYFLKM